HGQVFEVISYEYDEVGNKIKKEQSIDGKTSKEVFIYDAAERLVKHIDPLNHETTTAYHRREISPEQRYCRINRKVVLDPLGLQTISEFNEQAILKSLEKKDSKGKRIIQELYEYDLSKNLIKKTTILPERRVSTCWKYDSMNRIEQLIEAAGTSDEKITSYTYTPKGLLWKTTKPSGIILTNTYNELNQLILQTSSDGTIAYEYTYDKTGLLLASKDLNTQEQLTRKYDLKGRVEKETLSNGLVVKNKYDSLGRRKRITLPDNSSVIYEYDNWYLQRICRYDVNSTFLYSHTYEQRDLSGHILEEALPGFLGSLKHHYDVLGSHVEVSSSKFSHKALAFDPVHNLIEDL
ncbi:MAG: RHS repeat protein, partial [Verrucomicrobia bacterium]|nr:RHS repeat protein [Verrucomicrobiota bacterium]